MFAIVLVTREALEMKFIKKSVNAVVAKILRQ